MAQVEFGQCPQVHVAEAVAIRRVEGVAERVEASAHTLAGVCGLARVDAFDIEQAAPAEGADDVVFQEPDGKRI